MPDSPSPLAQAFSLSGQLALVTGGGTGLGYAMSSALLAAGAKVVITGRRADILEKAVASLGEGAHACPHDITDHKNIPTLIDFISREVGEPTILVNNAGVHLKKPFSETSDAEFHHVLATHVEGAFAMSRTVAARMKAGGHGAILFIASMTSLIGMPNMVAYSSAKSAIVGMVRALATELGPSGIRVNAIAPGWIETPMLHKALDNDPARTAKILGRMPQSRFGLPEDVGWAAVYLCSPAAQFINGVLLPVDGGASIGF